MTVVSTGDRPSATAPALAVRTSAVILDGDHMCLIRRRRPDGDQFSVPGGLVDQYEQIPAALARELDEELGLDLAAVPESAELRWIQDQIVTRPGTTDLFRRLHLIHLLRLPARLRGTLARTERDADDHNHVVWMDYRRAAEVHLYPAIGPALKAVGQSAIADGPVSLPAITDATFQWR